MLEKLIFDASYEAKYTINDRSSVHVQTCYKSRQEAEIEAENK